MNVYHFIINVTGVLENKDINANVSTQCLYKT